MSAAEGIEPIAIRLRAQRLVAELSASVKTLLFTLDIFRLGNLNVLFRANNGQFDYQVFESIY